MSYWIKSEEGHLINIDQVNEIKIESAGWKEKTFNLNADITLIKKFKTQKEAEKSRDFLFQKLNRDANSETLDELDFSNKKEGDKK